MTSLVRQLIHDQKISPPSFVYDNLVFEGSIGSQAYGCADGEGGDIDLVGIVMPPKAYLFPHLSGHIAGFGPAPPSLQDYQKHRIVWRGQRYDLCLYSIERAFHLMRDNNPNLLELLYLPRRCVYHSSHIYEAMRSQRHLFLHKRCYDRFHGYGAAQLTKIDKVNKKSKRRAAAIAEHGYDTKFGYHAVRLMMECRQLIAEGTMELDRHANLYRAIRAGAWSLEKLRTWFDIHERELLALLPACGLPDAPDDDGLRALLRQCIEHHYDRIQGVSSGGGPTAEERLAARMRAALDEWDASR